MDGECSRLLERTPTELTTAAFRRFCRKCSRGTPEQRCTRLIENKQAEYRRSYISRKFSAAVLNSADDSTLERCAALSSAYFAPEMF